MWIDTFYFWCDVMVLFRVNRWRYLMLKVDVDKVSINPAVKELLLKFEKETKFDC